MGGTPPGGKGVDTGGGWMVIFYTVDRNVRAFCGRGPAKGRGGELNPRANGAVDRTMGAPLAMNQNHLLDDRTGCDTSLEPEHVAQA